MTNQYIELNKLVKSPLNVRKTASKAADKELKASILSHGLMQNLVVTDARDGTYQVIAGARRLAAMQELIEKKKLPADHSVPCQVVTEERAAEMSLAENTVRQAMHPMDEFEAFSGLAEQGEKPEQIAKRFGVTAKHVHQRLRLGRIAPEIRQAYRDEKLSLDALMAYALTDDQTRQLRVFESLKGWQAGEDHHIRRALTDQMIRDTDKLAKFVGLDAYKGAGGTVKEDLFGEDVYLEDAELVNQLAGEKLEAEAQAVRAEGWGWVEVAVEREYRFTSQCGRIRPVSVDAPQELSDRKNILETKLEVLREEIDAVDDEEVGLEALQKQESEMEREIEEIEEKLASFTAFDPEQMKSAGCYLTIGYDGKLEIDKGLVKPEDKKAATKSMTGDSGEQEEADEPKARMSEPLKRDLEAYRLQAAQAEIAMNPEIAFDLLVFNVACGVLDHVSPSDGPDVHFRQSYPRPSVESETPASRRMEALRGGLTVTWLEPDGEAAKFGRFRLLPAVDKHRLLAYCTALTLKPKLAAAGREPTAYDVALEQIGANVAEYWRPTKDNYLSRITRDQLREIGQELFEGDFAVHYGKSKKGELVELLDKGFANPDKALDPDKVRRIAAWLPDGMAFSAMPESAPAKAKKGKKAA